MLQEAVTATPGKSVIEDLMGSKHDVVEHCCGSIMERAIQLRPRISGLLLNVGQSCMCTLIVACTLIGHHQSHERANARI